MYSIGIDVGGTGIQVGLVDSQGRILHRGGIVTRTDIPFEQQIKAIADCVLEVIESSGHTLDDISFVGAGVPGVTDPRTGNIAFCNNLGWLDAPFCREMKRWIDKPIYTDNDATVAALAESRAGVSAGTSSSVMITLGTGVGAGIVLGGKVWSGFHGVGSEIGHMILDLDGEPCNCGNRGCLERYCSATAIIRMAREAVQDHPDSLILRMADGDPEKINAKIVIDAARENDPVGSEVYGRYVRYLSQAVANIINFLDPEIVVLGGGVSKAGAFLLDAVREDAPRYLLYKALPYSRIELAQLGPDAGIIGAAMLGM